MTIPIKPCDHVSLEPTGVQGISRVVVEQDGSMGLSWDRYVRLRAAAYAARQLGATDVLDVGGFDGAIGFFLDGVKLDLLDPETTGGSILQIPAPDGAYEAVLAVDVLEHIEPSQRANALRELARVARRHVVLNYPGAESKPAQQLVLQLTDNPLIRQHVEWQLPDSQWVLDQLASCGFLGDVTKYASSAVWVGQYIAANLIPEVGREISRHLIEHHANEDASTPLYHLVVSSRK